LEKKRITRPQGNHLFALQTLTARNPLIPLTEVPGPIIPEMSSHLDLRETKGTKGKALARGIPKTIHLLDLREPKGTSALARMISTAMHRKEILSIVLMDSIATVKTLLGTLPSTPIPIPPETTASRGTTPHLDPRGAKETMVLARCIPIITIHLLDLRDPNLARMISIAMHRKEVILIASGNSTGMVPPKVIHSVVLLLDSIAMIGIHPETLPSTPIPIPPETTEP